ncbi:MAG: hypothetical protein WBP38_09545 [Hyphomicrobium sp.]|jgi:hypothetical protein|nr:hypothetical protein [Hyphomicrobium sp.]
MSNHRLPLLIALAVVACMSAPQCAIADPAGVGARSGAAQQAEPAKLSAREAGARYGQALGAIEICHGSKVTAAGDALGQNFTGADHDVFKAQAAKVFEAWRQVKACSNAADPNTCKIIMDKSCATAEQEIGPSGTVMPGLVEFMKH